MAARRTSAWASRKLGKISQKTRMGQSFLARCSVGDEQCLSSKICQRSERGLGHGTHLIAARAKFLCSVEGILPISSLLPFFSSRFKAENVFVRFLQDPWCATSNQRRHPYTFDQKLHRTSW